MEAHRSIPECADGDLWSSKITRTIRFLHPYLPWLFFATSMKCESLLAVYRAYADALESKLRRLGILTMIEIVPSERDVGRVIDDCMRRRLLYAIVINDDNELHMSITLNILHGTPQGECWVKWSTVFAWVFLSLFRNLFHFYGTGISLLRGVRFCLTIAHLMRHQIHFRKWHFLTLRRFSQSWTFFFLFHLVWSSRYFWSFIQLSWTILFHCIFSTTSGVLSTMFWHVHTKFFFGVFTCSCLTDRTLHAWKKCSSRWFIFLRSQGVSLLIFTVFLLMFSQFN